MSDFDVLQAALREMSDAEMTVMIREYAIDQAAAEDIRPRIGALGHGLVVAMAAEQDRRRQVLDAMARDIEGENVGELVSDVDAAIAAARLEFGGDNEVEWL